MNIYCEILQSPVDRARTDTSQSAGEYPQPDTRQNTAHRDPMCKGEDVKLKYSEEIFIINSARYILRQ